MKALSLQTASPIYANAVSAQAVVSYLIIGIPLLAYSLANRLVNFGSSLVGGLSGLQSTVGNASATAALGNSSMGNVSMDQRVVSPSTSNPWVSRSQDERGNWWTEDGAGRRAVSLLRNEGITSHQVSAKVSQSDVDAANKTASAAAADVLSAGTVRGASLNEALNKARQRTSSSRASAGQGTSGFEEVSRAAEQLSSEARRISKETGYDESQVAGTLLRFAATPSAFGVGGGGQVEKRYGASLSDAEKSILDHANSDTYRVARGFGDRATQDRSFLNAISDEGQSGVSLASSLVQTTTSTQAADRRFNDAISRSEETRLAFEKGETITRDLAQDPAYVDAVMEYERIAAQYGSNTQSLAAYFSSKLGNYSLNPTRFSDGSATPLSFQGVRELHQSQTGDADVNPDIAMAKATNDGDIGSRALASPPAIPQASGPGMPAMPRAAGSLPSTPPELQDPFGFRADVESRRAAQANSSGDLHQTYDQRHQIQRKPDGGVVTHKSLVSTAMTNLKRDTEVTVNDARDAANREMAAAKERAAMSPRQRSIDSTPEVPSMGPNSGWRKPRK